MAVKLRLKRMGSKQKPFYRIVAADSRSPRDGRFIETLGTYNPLLKADKVTLDEDKILGWLNNGAEPTDTVKSILSSAGVWTKFKSTKVKKPVAKKEVKAEEKPKPAAKKTTTKTTKKSES